MKRIIYTQQNGIIAIVTPNNQFKGDINDLAKEVVPQEATYEIVDDRNIPKDNTFRDAWEQDTGPSKRKIKVNLERAKEIAHRIRRGRRSELFRPLDLETTIPGRAEDAEASRKKIREEDAARQEDINKANTTGKLKSIMETI